jgi:hypothetical protein
VALTLLTIAQDAADQVGIVRPSVVYGNSAVEVRKLLRYANQAGRHLCKLDWQELRTEQTFTSLAAETQTAMVPSDLDHFIDETFWNRTRKRPLYGPKTPQEWQAIKGSVTSAVVDSFAYRGTDILINPTPTAGHTFAFEYISTKFCQSAGGVAAVAWAADDDTARISEELFTLEIVWRYKHGEGLPYQDDFNVCEEFKKKLFGQDSPRRTLGMAADRMAWPGTPGVMVPEGSWSV